MIAEAIDTAYSIAAALLAWIAVLAAAATIALYTAALTGAWAWRAARRRVTRPSWARGQLRARIHAHRHRTRHSGLTETPDYREAA